MSQQATDDALVPAGRRMRLAGLPLDSLSDDEILVLLERAVTQRRRIVLANLNLHGLYAALTTPGMAKLLDSPDTLVHIDGTPILWMAKLFGGNVPANARNAHIDLIPKMLKLLAERGWPVVIVGAKPEAAIENEAALRAIAPGLQVRAFHGYFKLDDTSPGSYQAEILDGIRTLKPALLLAGMGMPRQEEWIARIRNVVDVPITMPVGGFADYFAGRTRTAPRFLGPLGLEWLYRLVYDPRRLAFRYLVEPFLLAGLLARATVKGARWGRERTGPQVDRAA